jgi:D-alanyl-lipoteichoic acid acyltransferase DltB (MBOAT superfamily)
MSLLLRALKLTVWAFAGLMTSIVATMSVTKPTRWTYICWGLICGLILVLGLACAYYERKRTRLRNEVKK